jgi:hypothetical protein
LVIIFTNGPTLVVADLSVLVLMAVRITAHAPTAVLQGEERVLTACIVASLARVAVGRGTVLQVTAAIVNEAPNVGVWAVFDWLMPSSAVHGVAPTCSTKPVVVCAGISALVVANLAVLRLGAVRVRAHTPAVVLQSKEAVISALFVAPLAVVSICPGSFLQVAVAVVDEAPNV